MTMARLAVPSASPGGGRSSLVRADLERLLKLSGPVVLARLGIMTMGLMDAIVVGRYSAEQLGFHAMAWAPTSVVLRAPATLPARAADSRSAPAMMACAKAAV